MMFWIIAAVMVIVALAFVVLPLLKKPVSETDRRREQNIIVARDQLAELEAEFAAGRMEQSLYEQTRQELELSLHDNLAALEDITLEAPQGRSWFGVIIAGIFVPVMSIGMYLILGSPDLADPASIRAQEAVAKVRAGNATQTDVNEMVATLREKLDAQPDNLTGWTMLGRSYMVMQRFEDAAYAYGKARDLQPDDPALLLPLADATAMTQGGQLAGEPMNLVKRVLEVEPGNTMGLWLAGMGANQQGDKDATIEYWSKLESLLPAGSADQVEVRSMLVELGVDFPGAPAQTEVDSTAVIEVAVSLSDALREEAAADDLVFIYAKAVEGPPMPLAVERLKVSDLPVTVVLSDKQAMMPQMKLSGFETVTVGARVSKSGQPVAAVGDLYTEQSPVGLGAEVSLVIDTVKQ